MFQLFEKLGGPLKMCFESWIYMFQLFDKVGGPLKTDSHGSYGLSSKARVIIKKCYAWFN